MRIVDGNNLLHRVADGVGYGVHPVREVYSRFCSPPETTIIVWDGPYSKKRRQEIFPEYKSNRRPKEESKFQFFEIAKGVLRFTPVIQIEIPGWEADDIIGTLINKYHKKNNLVVETNDGDYWQHKDKCLLPLVTKKWHGMSADECLLYKSTVGESKGEGTGIKGFGIKAWEALNDETKRGMILAAKLEDQDRFFTLTDLPKKFRTTEAFGQMCLCWKLKSYWTVPEEEIDKHIQQGRLSIPAAEIFMEKFLI